MAYTAHGYQIPGSPAGSIQDRPKSPARCGGVEVCPKCVYESEEWKSHMIGEHTDFQAKAKQMVRDYVDSLHQQNFPQTETPAYEVYVVWFAKTLQNWKAILGTTMPDGRLFEITYDGNKRAAYFDVYNKIDNFAIADR